MIPPLTLPCLSLRQPWAWLVVQGGKDIENRKWNTKLRGTFLIHAAKGMTAQEWLDAETFARGAGFKGIIPRSASGAAESRLPRGGIVGAARPDSVIPPSPSPWPWHMKDQYGFVLQNITPLPFREYSGSLGFFRVQPTADEVAALRKAGLV